jgi:hypothetical protein
VGSLPPVDYLPKNKLNVYLSARNVSMQTLTIPDLNGGQGSTLPVVGSFIIEGDSRLGDTVLVSDIGNGLNTTYSFDPNTMKCGCCGKFDEKGRDGLVWVFTDQNFSPILPANGDGKCLKIIRTENGDMLSMVSGFLVKYGNAIISKDLILIGSASQLMREGLQGYVGSFLDTVDRLSMGSRMGCSVLPAPFIFLGGVPIPMLVNAVLDFHAWVRICGLDNDGVLNSAFGVVEDIIATEMGIRTVWGPANHKLPLNLPSRKRSCVSNAGRTNLPESVRPAVETTETAIIKGLISNLVAKFGFGLDCEPQTSRSKANSIKECPKLVVIGGQHAAATAAELESRGAQVKLLYLPHYRDCAVHAGKIREGLAGMEIDAETYLVCQVFDSGLYMAKTDEGALIPPCRRADGTYHIDGVLEFLDKDMQYALFKLVMEETLAFRKNPIVFMAPLPAYMEEGCCSDPEHASNRAQPTFKKSLEEAIYASRTNLKNFAFRHGLRLCTTISTWGQVKRLEPIWAGPTSLRKEGYSAIADAIVAGIGEMQKKRRSSEQSGTPAPKRAREQRPTPQGVQQPQPRGGRGRGATSTHQPQHQRGGSSWVKRGWGPGSNRGGWSRGQPRGFGGRGRGGRGGC